jgi:hypothetical protein
VISSPSVAGFATIAERQPRQRIEARPAANASTAIDQTDAFTFLDSGGDKVVADPEFFQLPPRRQQFAVGSTATPHVLDH